MVNLSIDGGAPTSMESVATPSASRRETPLYVGGMPVEVSVAAISPWKPENSSSFHGCIRNLYINSELQDFTKTTMRAGVLPGCEACRRIFCLHGVCRPRRDAEPVCQCQPGWAGAHCDQPSANTNPCHLHKCVHGACVALDTLTYRCECAGGYRGPLCNQQQELFNPCQSRRCQRGSCHVSELGEAECQCEAGHTGELCEQGQSLHCTAQYNNNIT
uniref:Uncharacterized protein n=1 Tax=Callorhinchus milii TaxID=7868 RepID=A0A4W3HFF9_CALMI